MIHRLFACAVFGASLLAMPSAHAETFDTCNGFITTLPASIGTQGVYCLKQDLSTSAASGQAISINANNVTLDCNGYKIGGLAAGSSTLTTGIYAQSKLNITIRNCTLRGFETGIRLSDGTGSSGGHVVEDNRLDLNTAIGIYVGGDNSTVRRNFVLNSGGSPFTTYPRGIATEGNVDVIENTVAGVFTAAAPGGGAMGVETTASESSNVVGNRISGLVGGQVFGIYNSGGSGHVKNVGNLVTGPSPAQASMAGGILCNDGAGIAKDNVITGWGASYDIYNCTDAGGNHTQP